MMCVCVLVCVLFVFSLSGDTHVTCDQKIPGSHPAHLTYVWCPIVFFFIPFVLIVNKKQIFTNSCKIKFAHIASILRYLE